MGKKYTGIEDLVNILGSAMQESVGVIVAYTNRSRKEYNILLLSVRTSHVERASQGGRLGKTSP